MKIFPQGILIICYFKIVRYSFVGCYTTICSCGKEDVFSESFVNDNIKARLSFEKRKERIDFIFASPKIAPFVVDGYVFNGRETDYISDHYPVCVDILVDKRLEK